jgi:hypothetical protein
MDKPQQAQRVSAVREYLAAIGQPISRNQGYEVLARALGLKSKHVLAAESGKAPAAENAEKHLGFVTLDGDAVRVLAVGAPPLSAAALSAMGWEVDCVIPLNMNEWSHDVEALNDHVSEVLTGSPVALQDIGYAHVKLPCKSRYPAGYSALRVTGYIPDPEEHFDEIAEKAETKAYADLAVLSRKLADEDTVWLSTDNQDYQPANIVSDMGALGALYMYAGTKGEPNIAGVVERWGAQAACELHKSDAEIVPLQVSELKYAERVDDKTFKINSCYLRFE